MEPTYAAQRRVLLVAVDPDVTATVQRVAAVAGLEVVPVAAGAAVAGAWRSAAPLVLDVAAVDQVASLPRRDDVLLATGTEADAATWRTAVGVGAEQVLVLPRQERALLAWFTEAGEPTESGRLVCCIPGRGGAGASTLAAALALATAAASVRTLLVDVDPGGGGQELLLGLERRPGVRWPDLAADAGAVDGAALAQAVPSVGAVAVLSCLPPAVPSLAASVVDAVVDAGLRGHAAVVADLARTVEAAGAAVLTRAAVALVVVSCDVRGASSAGGVVERVRQTCPDVRLVVRTPAPGDLRPRDVADTVGAPVAAEWPWDRRLGAVVDAGAFAARWRRSTAARVARRLTHDLALRPVVP